MKSEGHPDYHMVTVVMTDGTTFQTRSTYGKPGDTLQLDVDIKTHPVWTGGTVRLSEKAGQVAKFKKRFANFGI